MPIFEYTCNACHEMFALLQWTTEAKDTPCPQCGSKDVKKIPSSFSCASDGGSPSSGTHSGFSGGG